MYNLKEQRLCYLYKQKFNPRTSINENTLVYVVVVTIKINCKYKNERK